MFGLIMNGRKDMVSKSWELSNKHFIRKVDLTEKSDIVNTIRQIEEINSNTVKIKEKVN
jgi:hypothetical protein